MIDRFLYLLGFAELFTFFTFDYFYARALAKHKDEHPELEECAPVESPDLDTVAVLDSLTTTAIDMYHQGRDRLSGEPAGPSAHEYATLGEEGRGTAPTGAASDWTGAARTNPVHSAVVVCGVLAPVVSVLMLLMPGVMAWANFRVPRWIAYLMLVPGIAAVALYAARTTSLSGLVDISKTQWISMMWFRLDFMFIMSIVAVFGLGAWFVGGCMLSVAVYLAHRVMKMEKRLSHLQRATQLVRGEVDVQRVLVPGSAESKRAMGTEEGYSAL